MNGPNCYGYMPLVVENTVTQFNWINDKKYEWMTFFVQ